MASAGVAIANSALDGFWRKPDDARYKPVSKPVLLGFCRGILALCPPDNRKQAAALRVIADSLGQGGRLTDDMLRAFTPT